MTSASEASGSGLASAFARGLPAEGGFFGNARKIVGWRVSTTANAPFVLDALVSSGPRLRRWRALHERAPFENRSPIHRSDRGGRCLSIEHTERFADESIEPPVGSVGDTFDNALAATVIGLFETEVIRRLGPWRNTDELEAVTLE